MNPSTVRHPLSLAAFGVADAAPSLAESALDYARAGVPVPCVPGRKPPLTGAGYKPATTNTAHIEVWWREHPDANIGIPTGAVSGLGVVDIDIDIDIDGGVSGRPVFEHACDAHLVDGWAWSVQTPSGGQHVYYPHDPATSPRCWTTSSHIVHPVDASALRRFIDPPRPPRPANLLIPGRGGSLDRVVDRVGRRGPGTRNSGLFWAACEMARQGITRDAALASLSPAAQRAGLGEREIGVTGEG